jgi:peptide-methionine (S)-S-oxide reductase
MKATFAAGCFWGTEHIFNKHFKDQGITTKVGYIGGDLEAPSYKQVKTGTTQHAEGCEITFDPSKVSFETLTEFFYKMHGNKKNTTSKERNILTVEIDPTTLNYQGPDIGTQYRSAIFYHDESQKEMAEIVTKKIQEKHYPDAKIVTEIVPATTFYDAEDYHQFYLENNPEGYACPTHYLRW